MTTNVKGNTSRNASMRAAISYCGPWPRPASPMAAKRTEPARFGRRSTSSGASGGPTAGGGTCASSRSGPGPHAAHTSPSTNTSASRSGTRISLLAGLLPAGQQLLHLIHHPVHLPDRQGERLVGRHVDAGVLQEIDRVL